MERDIGRMPVFQRRVLMPRPEVSDNLNFSDQCEEEEERMIDEIPKGERKLRRQSEILRRFATGTVAHLQEIVDNVERRVGT